MGKIIPQTYSVATFCIYRNMNVYFDGLLGSPRVKNVSRLKKAMNSKLH
jgi:hypothetical protein